MSAGRPTPRQVAVPVATVWRAPDSPRDVDEAAVRDLPDAAAWADAMDQQVRLGLHGRTETQLLLGDPVLVLEEAGDWSRVVAPTQRSSQDGRGYPGWVRTAHLATPDDAAASVRVVARSAACAVAGGPTLELSRGTCLVPAEAPASPADGTVGVRLPGGRTGRVPREAVETHAPDGVAGPRDAARPSADALLDRAREYLGLRYLWGGTSTWGLDCSGFVHLVLRSFGVDVPRDAHDQAAALPAVDLAAVRPGDAYFFARPGGRVYHVGFVTRPVAADGTRWMLHAPEGGELIEDAPLAGHRVEHLVAAGRLL